MLGCEVHWPELNKPTVITCMILLIGDRKGHFSDKNTSCYGMSWGVGKIDLQGTPGDFRR